MCPVIPSQQHPQAHARESGRQVSQTRKEAGTNVAWTAPPARFPPQGTDHFVQGLCQVPRLCTICAIFHMLVGVWGWGGGAYGMEGGRAPSFRFRGQRARLGGVVDFLSVE